jgi:hypothetical protein
MADTTEWKYAPRPVRSGDRPFLRVGLSRLAGKLVRRQLPALSGNGGRGSIA